MPEVKPMNVRSSGSTDRRASIVGRSVLAVVLVGTIGPASAGPQNGRAVGNPLPAQPFNNTNPYATAYGRGRYSPYPVKDATAAERAVLAGRAYWAALGGEVQRTLTPPRVGGVAADAADLFPLELAERLGRWSLRWQEAQDNASKSRAERYRSVMDHLGRMTSMEDGRSVRDALERAGFPAGRAVALKPPRLFAEIARFFRPADGAQMDQVVPWVLEVERPLNPRDPGVTLDDRVEIASRAYRTILDDAVARFLAARGAGRRDEGAIFDAALAERLGVWSDLWRQVQEAADRGAASRSAAVRNLSSRPALADVRLMVPDSRPATIRSHIERMSALADGRFLSDALKRSGRPAEESVDMTGLREFTRVARYFRIAAEGQLPGGSRRNHPDTTSASPAATAGRISRAIWDEAARRYLKTPRAGGAHPDARPVFDSRLAERLGEWSIRWGRAQAVATEDFASRFAALRSHIERMETMEDGRSLQEALERVGKREGPPPALPREFTEVARFFRLEAQWELAQIRSR
jgi:hypothetical protein